MWCKSCRQDVPGIASLEEGAFHCARCGGRVGRKRSLMVESLAEGICDQGIDLGAGESESTPEEALHAWAEDEHLEKARRLLRPLPVAAQRRMAEQPTSEQPTSEQPELRFDPPASETLRVHVPGMPVRTANLAERPVYPRGGHLEQPLNNPSFPQPEESPGAFAALAWGVVSLGLMGMVCGGVLVVWSLITGRSELWNLGLPIAMAGQGVLLVGILVSVFGKRSPHGHTSSTHYEAHPTMLSPTPHGRHLPLGSPASGGATHAPALLAELRGQLEQLSAQIASENSPAHRPWL